MRTSFWGLWGLILLMNSCESPSRNESVELITISEYGCDRYIKKVSWGITGDHIRYYLSASALISDTATDPFLIDDFFYRLDKDCNLIIAEGYKVFRNTDSLSIIQRNDGKINYQNYSQFGFKSIIWD